VEPDPPPGGGRAAGYEDYALTKAKGGLTVEFTMTGLQVGGVGCHGSLYSGEGEYDQSSNQDPVGFIPARKIGRKLIKVAIAGSFAETKPGAEAAGEISGTLTLKRRSK